jgi:hypothetical protein
LQLGGVAPANEHRIASRVQAFGQGQANARAAARDEDGVLRTIHRGSEKFSAAWVITCRAVRQQRQQTKVWASRRVTMVSISAMKVAQLPG